MMYRLFALASSLLVASSSALTVVDTKPSGFTPIRLDIDLDPPAAESSANACARNHKVGPTSRGRYDAAAYAHNACCADYPLCGCPKLETPAVASQKLPGIKLPAVARNDSSQSCCPDFPLCSCPKLEIPTAVENLRIKLPAVKAKADSSQNCCPDYPFCSHYPSASTQSSSPRFQVINVGSASKTARSPGAAALLETRPRELVGATTKASGGCCPDYPYCGCPKL